MFIYLFFLLLLFWASLVAQLVKNPPAMRQTWVRSLGWDDPLEEGMATHASILAWKIPWTEEPSRLRSMGSQRVRHDWVTKHSTAQHKHSKGFLGGSDGKESAHNAGDWGLIPGSEDTLEKGMATHSSILAWRIPWAWHCKESEKT